MTRDWLLSGDAASGALQWGALIGVSFVTALAALWLMARLGARADRRGALAGDAEGDAAIAFLFDNEALVDATPQARRLLAAAPAGGSEWTRLMMLLLPRFPEVETRIGNLDTEERITFTALDERARLIAEWRSGLIRLTMEDTELRETPTQIEAQGLRAMEQEIDTLRAVTDQTPCLVWRQTRRGQITWANRVYVDVARRVRPERDGPAWPPPTLFEPSDLMTIVDGEGTRRLSLAEPGAPADKQIWFDLASHPLGEEVLFVAQDVNAIVHAEGQLRDFMNTLTKTFAHLTIGLAIFDRSRHLALFNPALTDLTQLPIDFLASRPTLFGFLDRLREKKMIPEPKDYKGWRKKLIELEAAAAEGSYMETWSLPSGQTYRVTGRPHPDGAVALLFENISAEISLTRRFRSELEMGQAVIDSLDEAIAVFASDGVLTMSNKAYEALWGDDPGTSIRDISVADATRTWTARCSPTPIWGDIRDFAARPKERVEWFGEVRMNDGRGLICRVCPLGGGATLVGFSFAAATSLAAGADRADEAVEIEDPDDAPPACAPAAEARPAGRLAGRAGAGRIAAMPSPLLRLDLPSPRATADFAAALAPGLAAGDVILLEGPIGAGKTHFARALIQARLVAAGRAEDVPSPTFTLVQVYDDGVAGDLARRPLPPRRRIRGGRAGPRRGVRDGALPGRMARPAGPADPARRADAALRDRGRERPAAGGRGAGALGDAAWPTPRTGCGPMFEGVAAPRLFALPPGADFAARFVAGLMRRAAGMPPEALARVQIYVNAGRMLRQLRAAFDAQGPLLLPRLRLVTDLGADTPLPGLPPPVSALRRRLELARLVAGLLERRTRRWRRAPRSSTWPTAWRG